jgi:hypothetical protein
MMSIAKCRMLSATLADVGPVKYVLGNFAMHYFPLLQVAFSGKVDFLRADAWRQALAAGAVVTGYCALSEVTAIYGCFFVHTFWVAIALIAAAMVPPVAALAYRHFFTATRQ